MSGSARVRMTPMCPGTVLFAFHVDTVWMLPSHRSSHVPSQSVGESLLLACHAAG